MLRFTLILLWLLIAAKAMKSIPFFISKQPPNRQKHLDVLQTLFPFLVYLLTGLLSSSFTVLFDLPSFSPRLKPWLETLCMATTTLSLFIYLYFQDYEHLQTLFFPVETANKCFVFFKNFFKGACCWLISYPFVLLVAALLEATREFIYGSSLEEQLAVSHLKNSLSNPFLFTTTIFFLVLAIPFAEEVLFRGYLQNWLGRLFSKKLTILITSLIFAAFHLSDSQGIKNIDIFCSLFTFSCFLSYFYEQKGSLSISLGLHSAFNATTIIFIYFSQ